MKTIKEAAKESAKKMLPLQTDLHSYFREQFKDGVEFAQRWIPVEEELPLCYESGLWDGLRSDFVLVKFQDGRWTKARLYSGILDGNSFNDWCNENDYQLYIITHWRPIELK